MLAPGNELLEGQGDGSLLGLLATQLEDLIEQLGVKGKMGRHVRLLMWKSTHTKPKSEARGLLHVRLSGAG